MSTTLPILVARCVTLTLASGGYWEMSEQCQLRPCVVLMLQGQLGCGAHVGVGRDGPLICGETGVLETRGLLGHPLETCSLQALSSRASGWALLGIHWKTEMSRRVFFFPFPWLRELFGFLGAKRDI